MPRPTENNRRRSNDACRTPELAALALDVLDKDEARRVEDSIASAPGMQRELDDMAAHLVMYDRIEKAPSAPQYEVFCTRLQTEAVGESETSHGDRSHDALTHASNPFIRWRSARLAVAACALVALCALALWGTNRNDPITSNHDVARVEWMGPGVVSASAATNLSKTVRPKTTLAPGTWFYGGEGAGEVRYATRDYAIRVVLSAGASLRYANPNMVYLEKGKAWFDVSPGAGFTRKDKDVPRRVPFSVRSPLGDVRVVGTSFLVDVNRDAFSVGVWHGAVQVTPGQGTEETDRSFRVGSRETLSFGRASRSSKEPIRTPFASLPAFLSMGLELSTRIVADGRTGKEWVVDCVFRNRGGLRLSLLGDDAGQSPLWLHVSDERGGQVSALPVLPANIVRRPGETPAPWISAPGSARGPDAGMGLAPGEARVVRVRFQAPRVAAKALGGPLGRYFCRAVYRGEALPPLQSRPISIHAAPSPLTEDEAAEDGAGSDSKTSSRSANGEAKPWEPPGR